MMKTNIQFLRFLAYGKSEKLNSEMLNHLQTKEYKILQKIVHKVVKGSISLNRSEYYQLKPFKSFLRRMSLNTIKPKELIKNCGILKTIARIGVKNDQICGQVRSNSVGTLESNAKESTSDESSDDQSTSDSDSDKESSASEEEISGETTSDGGDTSTTTEDRNTDGETNFPGEENHEDTKEVNGSVFNE